MNNMEQLVEKINRLQSIMAKANVSEQIELPQIVVVGSQSSGKSSVVENIVGFDFLPRGTGIVTRRPLILQLVNRDTDVYAEFMHVKKKYTNFEEVRQEIMNDTNKVIGNNKDISSSPIVLRIYSRTLLTLTLVDLPGLTRVPVGDQPRDISIRIKELCRQFVQNKNALILAVSPANADLANSDALRLAKEVDPAESRTIGVLTKIDLMDAGTDVVDILAGKVVKLKHGFIPVVNRAQLEIESNKSIESALADEEKFFLGHPKYKRRAEFCGTKYLRQQLHAILVEHIRSVVPELRMRIGEKLSESMTLLSEIGEHTESSQSVAVNVVSNFCKNFASALEGETHPGEEIGHGARISYVFNTTFAEHIETFDISQVVKDSEIRMLLFSLNGTQPGLFNEAKVFTITVRKLISLLVAPSLECVSLVHGEMMKLVGKLMEDRPFKQYPKLRDVFSRSVHKVFRTSLEETEQFVRTYMDCQLEYINTIHPDFIRGHEAVTSVNEKFSSVSHKASEGYTFFRKKKDKHKGLEPPSILRSSESITDSEKREIEIVKILLESYFRIIKRSVVDILPKIIMKLTVKNSLERLQEKLFSELIQPDSNEIFVESETITQQRETLKLLIKTLKEAYDVLHDE